MRIIPAITAALLLAAPFSTSQSSLVHPAVQENLEGGAASLLPLGYKPGRREGLRYLQVDDLRPKKDILVKGMAFRPDGAMTSPWKPFETELDLRISIARRRSSLVNPWFDANHGKGLTTVLSRKTVKFPGFAGVGPLPAPFLFRLPFDGGKVFRLPAGKEICWDLHVFSSTVGAACPYLYLDSVWRGRGFFARNIGGGGRNPRWKTPVLLSLRIDFAYPPPLALSGMADFGPPKGAAFLFLSTKALSKGIPLGAWGGLLKLDPAAIFLPVGPFEDPGGTGTYFLTPTYYFYPGPYLRGVHFFAQAVIAGKAPSLPVFTNALECLASESWRNSLPGTGTVYLPGRNALVSPTGEAHPDQGVVVKYFF